ncbi:hypothetical protein SMQE01_07920 [Serratia marcescens]|nr:hypothetical protein SMQE01_07920 [Serratia marcescens]
MNITLRHETPADVGAIATLTAAAFLHAEHSSHTEQFIVSALRAAGALTLSLVAEHNGTPIGHASVSPIVLSNGAAGWYGLAPVSVLPAYQSQGIGSRLIRRLRSAGRSELLRPFRLPGSVRAGPAGRAARLLPRHRLPGRAAVRGGHLPQRV